MHDVNTWKPTKGPFETRLVAAKAKTPKSTVSDTVTKQKLADTVTPSPAQADPPSSPPLLRAPMLSHDSSFPIYAAMTILGITLPRSSKSAPLPSARSPTHMAYTHVNAEPNHGWAMELYCRSWTDERDHGDELAPSHLLR